MKAINPYLNFNGNAEEAFTFYKSIFGGDFAMVMRFKDTQGSENIPANEQDYIMHIALPLAGNMLMGSDVPSSMGKITFSSSVTLSIHTDSREEADKAYAGLSDGGQATMPLADMFWGDYWGMLTDKFGISWMVSFNSPRQ
jgi:PhnB protein